MPNRRPSSRRTVLLSILTVVLALAVGAGAFFAVRAATFTDQASVPANTFTTDTLDPPTGLTATIFWYTYIELDWIATVDTYATGYKVLRSTTPGGPYTEIGTADGPYTFQYYDQTADPGVRDYYVLQTYFQNWTSVYSMEANAMVPGTGWRSPAAEAAVTSSSGDNNGFQTTPANAFADDASYAEDPSSGTSGSSSCTSTARDRHQFYTYGFDIPSGSTINGIKVRLDAWVDLGIDNPKMCVQLSWDGGTNWTTATPARTTANLTNSQQTYSLGSVGDSWGHTWSPTEFDDANFRLRITNIADSAVRNFRLDWVAVNVAYTPP
ncbi:MAG: hypothetical protein MUP14_03405 [Dehalococcoidia bacterium]|nr:hypothetical protein [Dehalococcoidia bacterium]